MSGFGVLEYIDKKETENPGKFWIITYLLVFIAPLILSAGLYFSLKTFNFSTSLDDDTTRYLLSAFIQSLAAIIAIVVSLTLVAIQFTASEYSIKVIEIFKKNPAMWAIIAGYISGISLFAFILMSISDSQVISGIKSYCVFYSFFLFIALLTILIPYIWITLNHMNVEKVIDNLCDDLDYKEFINLGRRDDPFYELFVIINNSAIKGDIVSLSYGFDKIQNKFFMINEEIRSNFFSQLYGPSKEQNDGYFNEQIYQNFKNIISGFCDNVERTSLILFEKREEKFIYEIVVNLGFIFDIAFLDNVRTDSVRNSTVLPLITNIGIKAIDEKYVNIYSKCLIIIFRRIRELTTILNQLRVEESLVQIRFLLDRVVDFGHAFMKNGEGFHTIKSAYNRAASENRYIPEDILDFPGVIDLFVDYNKELVNTYMRSPECQNGKYFLEPIREIASYTDFPNVDIEQKKKYLHILRDIGIEACEEYNLPEISILVNKTLMDIGFSSVQDNLPEISDIIARYLTDLYYLCPEIQKKGNKEVIRYNRAEGVNKKEYDYNCASILSQLHLSVEPSDSQDDETASELWDEYNKSRHFIE